MRFSLNAAVAALAVTLGAALGAAPSQAVLANLSEADIYVSNVLFKGMGKTPEVVLIYNEDPEAARRRAPVVLSPWLSFGRPATQLIRPGEAVLLEALKPTAGHVSELALLSADGKQQCALHYTLTLSGTVLLGSLRAASANPGAVLDTSVAGMLIFDGFDSKKAAGSTAAAQL